MNGGDDVIASSPLDWRFSQVFGERSAGEEVQEVDIISAIEFDKSGDHLATGDRGGRVVLFERTDSKNTSGSRRDLEGTDYPLRHPEFRYKTEFQSHEPEFDYLKSLEIEEKINKIRWSQTANGALFLLSTNDKTIKFWKVQEKKIKKICDINTDSSRPLGNGSVASSSNSNSTNTCLSNGGLPDKVNNYLSNDYSFPPGGIPSLQLPAVTTSPETSPVARCRRVYTHAHDYHINSISNNRRIGLIKKGEDTTGSQVAVKIVKNKLAPPFRTAQFELEFGKGSCKVTEIIELSIKHKFIAKNGTFYNLNGKKYHGKEALKKFLRLNERSSCCCCSG